MLKPKPKIFQEVSPSLLSPLFERGCLEPTHPASRRLWHKNHNSKSKMLQEVSPSLLSILFERGRFGPTIPAVKKCAQCSCDSVTQTSDYSTVCYPNVCYPNVR
ncbi:hypothetical protein L596_025417 [Steinernema carpocapsae]|uniref:Uncharacterized protein n=1 Tax=Steinernema carpocapsae TaxID=34508 RepID=A0A4U5M7Q9_STECR|nr:hypothetical protein L596_025417 [Steinernema carpocapsae]